MESAKMRRKAFSLTELLIITAIIAILAAILFPVFRVEVAANKVTNKPNLQKISKAAIQYGQDYDERIPLMINGYYRDMLNVRDGTLNQYNEPRTDAWPLILMPYLKDRTVFADPRRDDVWHIWSGPPLATNDAGYVGVANTYRNQDRFPEFGVNYLFLSPLAIPPQFMGDATPTDYMSGQSRAFFDADHPAKTLFYVTSTRGFVQTSSTDSVGQLDTTRGYFGIDAPGMWALTASSTTPFVIFWNGTNCSGDWCGDANAPALPEMRTQNYAYIEPTLGGNNVAFLDGHAAFESDVAMAAGTNYLTASPSGVYFGGGAVVTDKSKYMWNLNNDFFGIY